MKIINLKIGTRLLLGFAIVLSLSAVSIAAGIWNMHRIADATRQMMEKPLAKERMVSDWYGLTSEAVTMTSFIVKSTDTTLAATFADHIAAGVKQAVAIRSALPPLLSSDLEKQMFNVQIKTVMERYQKAKAAAVKAKSEGKAEEAAKIYTEEFVPSAKLYTEEVSKFLEFQRSNINQIGLQITELESASAKLMILLGVLIAALGFVFAIFISRSITIPLGEALGVALTVATGDLTSHIEVKSKDETGRLIGELKAMNENLHNTVSQVRSRVSNIATATSEIATGNLDLSSRTEEQAASLEEIAASINELNSTVKQNADNAQLANQLAIAASGIAVKGGSVVSEVVKTMNSINVSAMKIVDIIGVIDGIAFQTNILALNAAVEAARAGEQGRGFAVVATEVRGLAQRSAAAAKEIKSLIGTSVEKVDAGTRLVGDAGSTMDELLASVKRVADLIGEISAASSQQSVGIEQVNSAIMQMDQVTQQNAALVEEAAASAELLQDQAHGLMQAVSAFKLDQKQKNAPNHLPARAMAVAPPVS
ncbi:MAG: hypothetical protein JWP38_3027 [Herbaspirillum sp.]|jgi:methyl-accepting chemotaxis protein|nr:hypothetical protein [Herbaspirillum sp.]